MIGVQNSSWGPLGFGPSQDTVACLEGCCRGKVSGPDEGNPASPDILPSQEVQRVGDPKISSVHCTKLEQLDCKL